MLRRAVLGLLILGSLVVIAEGVVIGVRYVWLRDAPWLFRLMLPAIFIGLAAVLAAMGWSRARARRSLRTGL